LDRIVRSGLHQGEQALTGRVVARLLAQAMAWIEALVDPNGPPDDEPNISTDNDGESVLGLVKSVLGKVSLESLLTETRKLRAVRAAGLPAGLFADVAPKVLAGWRTRAAVESPSHLLDHPAPLRLTLVAGRRCIV
jgi:hypothetical protein